MQIKRTLTFFDEVVVEAGQTVDPPLRKVAVVAVIDNPFAGKFERDLSPLTKASEQIGRTICTLAVSMLAPCKPESYGKAAIIGINGEQEHGVSLLTTVFGNVMRDAAGGGKAWISSLTKRAAPGSTIDIPLAHMNALYVRSHYDGITITIPGRSATERDRGDLRLSPAAAAQTTASAGSRRATSRASTGLFDRTERP